ncbi:MAG: DNA repair protein RecN [Salibacteraceae bacterium]
MLKHLQISNYALIAESSVAFNDKLVTVTGESGAGKSIMINALAMVLGDRADFSVIRKGQEKCFVEATFEQLTAESKGVLKAHGLDVYDQLILRRELTKSGRSRAFVNDTPVALNVLKSIAERLVDLYSQHEQTALNKLNYQGAIFDAYAGVKDIFSQYSIEYSKFKGLKNELRELQEAAAQIRKDKDYFTFQLEELNSIRLDELDLDALEEEVSTLENAEQILSTLGQVESALNSDGGLTESLSSIMQLVRNIAQHNPRLNALSERLESVKLELDDIAFETTRTAEGIELDPSRLAQVQEQIDALNRLLHKHGAGGVVDLQKIRDEYAMKVAATENFDEEVVRIEQELKSAYECSIKHANTLTQSRKEAVGTFETKVVGLLAQLGMAKAAFKVKFVEQEELHERGKELVRFLIDANGLGQMQPIEKVASGGEMARLMLALKAVSQSSLAQCLIFDEIDSGVSGEVANRIGALMAKLSLENQCIAITHLPGVASKGDQHLKIYKTERDGAVTSEFKSLTEEERIKELAMMFSGDSPSEAALETARSLRAH